MVIAKTSGNHAKRLKSPEGSYRKSTGYVDGTTYQLHLQLQGTFIYLSP